MSERKDAKTIASSIVDSTSNRDRGESTLRPNTIAINKPRWKQLHTHRGGAAICRESNEYQKQAVTFLVSVLSWLRTSAEYHFEHFYPGEMLLL